MSVIYYLIKRQNNKSSVSNFGVQTIPQFYLCFASTKLPQLYLNLTSARDAVDGGDADGGERLLCGFCVAVRCRLPSAECRRAAMQMVRAALVLIKQDKGRHVSLAVRHQPVMDPRFPPHPVPPPSTAAQSAQRAISSHCLETTVYRPLLQVFFPTTLSVKCPHLVDFS